MVTRRWPLLAASVLAVGLTPGPVRAADRFVSIQGDDAGNVCLASATPCRTIGHAVAQSVSGDVIKVARGTYAEQLLIDTSTTLTISGSWEADFSSRDAASYGTKLHGAQVLAGLGETVDVTLDGLMVTGSNGVRASSSDDGILDLRLTSCAVRRNPSGAVTATATQGSTLNLEITDSIIARNQRSPAGIFVSTSDTAALTLAVVDSVVERNNSFIYSRAPGITGSASAGGTVSGSIIGTRITRNQGIGISWGGATLTLTDVSIVGNRDGGLSCDGTTSLANVVVAKNIGAPFPYGNSLGGIISVGVTDIVNSTIWGNKGFYPGIMGWPGTTLTLTNTITWGNRSGWGDLRVSTNDSVSAAYCDLGEVTGPAAVTDLGGNISANPLFVSSRDQHLTAGSPAIDAGTCTGAPAMDFEGDTRPTGGGCDMGADEFVP